MGVVEGQWTYNVENGGASIIASTAIGAVTIPSVLGGYAVKKVGSNGPSIFGYPNNTTVTSLTIPNTVTSIGTGAFNACFTLVTVFLPTRFATTYTGFNLTASQVSFYDASSPSSVFSSYNLYTSTQNNSNFTAGQAAVIADPNSYSLYTATQYTANFTAGKLSGQADVRADPNSYYLYTATQYTDNFTAGRNDVINSPNSNGLYTTSQIENMAVGDLVLTKDVNGGFVLNYDIEQSADLQTWTTYAPLSLPLTGLPTDKAFVRIKAKQ